jgi:hypothetical protein
MRSIEYSSGRNVEWLTIERMRAMIAGLRSGAPET